MGQIVALVCPEFDQDGARCGKCPRGDQLETADYLPYSEKNDKIAQPSELREPPSFAAYSP